MQVERGAGALVRAGHRPVGDAAVACDEAILRVPIHVGDVGEAVAQEDADGCLALQLDAGLRRPAGGEEDAILGEVGQDAFDIAAVEGGLDLHHQGLGHGGHSRAPRKISPGHSIIVGGRDQRRWRGGPCAG
ncbi:Uncharacterized protein APZ42_003153 [Daphnia magna]|uniref:Uncharacterized protein n=1 Tax=Daphnia magna TaxID=35525 RepID=A0A164HSH9_9CRUS|nr:Uncharacterized protein APZ42_003153 [Daphnia magna]